MSKNKADNSNLTPENLMLISIFYQIILVIGKYVLFGRFELGDEVLDVYRVDKTIVECRSDEDLMLYYRYEFWVELVMRHVKLPC